MSKNPYQQSIADKELIFDKVVLINKDPFIGSTSDRLHSEFVLLLFLQEHRETDRFLQFQEFSLHNLPVFDKAGVLWITLNIDGAPISSKSHTHPSHSQTSRLLTSSLSLGVPVPRVT